MQIKIAFLIVSQICSVVTAAEVAVGDRDSLVAIQPDEKLRSKFISILGDMDQYEILWIHPGRLLYIAALRGKTGKNERMYEVLFWREGLRKEDLIKTKTSPEDVKSIIESFDHLLKGAGKNSFDKEDMEFPDRVMVFKRFINGNTYDWKSVSVRSNSENIDFLRICNLILPEAFKPDRADCIKLLNEKPSG